MASIDVVTKIPFWSKYMHLSLPDNLILYTRFFPSVKQNGGSDKSVC
jgi:hypothetical protein